VVDNCLQRMDGEICLRWSILYQAPGPRAFGLVVGFGAGVTAGSFVLPGIRSIVIANWSFDSARPRQFFGKRYHVLSEAPAAS